MTTTDRARIALNFEADRLKAEVLALPLHAFLEYNVLPLTAPHSILDDDGKQPVVSDYADGKWARWPSTGHLTACPYLEEVVDFFRAHTRVTLVRLLRLAPGGVVGEHCDPTLGLEQADSVIRLTVPIYTNDGAVLFLNDAVVPMQPGECWYLRFSDPHRAVNGGDTERIHLSIDMEPNAWIREQIGGLGIPVSRDE